jgi:hypothetical protein
VLAFVVPYRLVAVLVVPAGVGHVVGSAGAELDAVFR